MAITDAKAKAIAGDWFGGLSCPLALLYGIGYIDGATWLRVTKLLTEAGDTLELRDRTELESLLDYVTQVGHRQPVAGWDDL